MIRSQCTLTLSLYLSAISVAVAVGPDPTAPIGTSDFVETREPITENMSVDTGPSLQEILLGPKRVLAVIDGKTMKVGDRFRNYTVLAIGPNQVTLQIDGVNETLYLVDTRVVKR